MTITSSSFAKALYPGVNSWFGQSYNEYSPEYPKLFDTYNVDRAYIEDVSVSSFGLAQRKPEGQAISYDDERQGFITRYTPIVFALGFNITREAYEDDLYGVVGKRRATGLAFSMRQTKEIVGANVYNRAFSGTYTGGDGVSLLNASHPNVAGGAQSNVLAVASDLSEASLEQMCIDISKWTNDRGLKIALMPKTLIIPVDLQFEAERILKTQYRVGTANNDINALYTMGKFPGGIVVNNYLTDPNAWFIRTNLPSDGMKYLIRRKMEFGIDNDFDTENAKYKASERYCFGWSDWRAVAGSEGA